MKKGIIFISAGILIIVSLFFVTFRNQTHQVCFNDKCFNVELATTSSEQETGLMYRKSLNNNSGMLFIFQQEANHSFWMKNTIIALDIIWLSSDNQVVYVSRDTQPCNSESCPPIIPDNPAKFVLEINPNQINPEVGDKLTFKNIEF